MKKDKFPKRTSADWIQSELTSTSNGNKDISNKTNKKVEDKSTDPVCTTKAPDAVSSSKKKRSAEDAQSSIDTAKIQSKDTKQILESKGKDKIGKASSVEIDDLFQSIKRQKASNSLPLSQTLQQQSVKLTEEDKLFCDTKGIKRTRHKLTEEGYPIYTPEELGISTSAGNTEDCPFDCNCCF